MNGYCKDHITIAQDIAEIKRDVKWLCTTWQNDQKKFNGHVKEGIEYRKQINRNSAFRVILCWFIGVLLTLGTLTVTIIKLFAK